MLALAMLLAAGGPALAVPIAIDGPALDWPTPGAATGGADAPAAPSLILAPQSAEHTPAETPAAAAPRHARGDPFEKLNRRLFNSSQKFDRAFFRPLAMGYKTVVPKPARSGLRNLISNIGEPIVFLNDLLQLRPKRAVKTLARFLINSTVGLGGLIDVAKKAELPHRNNGFGNTLGHYGVGPGPYLFVPFLGPTDLRDLFGGQADAVIYPTVIGRPFNRVDYILSKTVISGLDLRVESDAQLKALLDGAADPYATLRSVYLQSRKAEIAEINGETLGALDDPLLDPDAASAGDNAAPADAQPPAEPDAIPPADAPEPPAEPPQSPETTPEPATPPPPPSSGTMDAATGTPEILSFFSA